MSHLLIDGNNLLFRLLAVQPWELVPAPEPRLGFLKALAGLRRDLSGSRLVVAWDGGRSSRRVDLYPLYKRRPDTRPQVVGGSPNKTSIVRSLIHPQSEAVRDLIEPLGVGSVILEGREGDDLLYRMSRLLDSKDTPSILVTEDGDLLQAVSPLTRVYIPSKKLIVDLDSFMAVTGVPTPVHYLMRKALMGDNSDNLPGMEGVGTVTATRAVLKHLPLDRELRLTRAVVTEFLDTCMAEESRMKGLSEPKVRRDIMLNLLLMDLSAEPFTQEELDAIHLPLYTRNPVNPVRFGEAAQKAGVYRLIDNPAALLSVF